MKQTVRVTALTLTASIGLSFFSAGAAQAGSKGRQNTALVLGAVTAYGIVKKQPALAGVAGAGALYSYVSSRNAAKKEREEARRREARRRLARRSRVRTRYVPVRTRYVPVQTARHTHTPPGWSKGKKNGWHKRKCDD